MSTSTPTIHQKIHDGMASRIKTAHATRETLRTKAQAAKAEAA
jgi:hypothetical protein